MEISKEFSEMVRNDILRLENSKALSFEEKKSLHLEIDGRYQSCVKDWYAGMNGVNENGISLWWFDNASQGDTDLTANLYLMKAKLETFQYGVNAIKSPAVPSTNVTVTTNVNVSVTFDQVREKIEDMTSLTEEQTKEILDKITEIEEVVNSKDKKKTKWEKVKPVLAWLADKSCDVGIALLPLLLKI